MVFRPPKCCVWDENCPAVRLLRNTPRRKTHHPNESNHLLDITKKPILDVEQTTNKIFHICCPPHPPQQLKKLVDFPSKNMCFFLSGSKDLKNPDLPSNNFQQWQNPWQVAAIKAPGFGDNRKAILQESFYTSAKGAG